MYGSTFLYFFLRGSQERHLGIADFNGRVEDDDPRIVRLKESMDALREETAEWYGESPTWEADDVVIAGIWSQFTTGFLDEDDKERSSVALGWLEKGIIPGQD